MISDILRLHLYDRIFILEAVFYCWGIHQANVRAFYKMLYGKSDPCVNDTLVILGLIGAATLPFIGIFDEIAYRWVHYTFAGLFFGSSGIYIQLLSSQLNKYSS